MSEHAFLSASSAHRWLICTASARLEQEFPDNSGDAAAEGSAAHALAEHKLRKALRMRSKKPVSKFDCDEMDVHTDDYVAFVMEQIAQAKQKCIDPLVLIEQRLDFSHWVKEGFGTGDFVLITDGALHIVDLKYGQGLLVEAEGNPQLKLYSLGALELFDSIYDIDTISMTVFQPRRENVSTHTVSKESLYKWALEILKPTAALAYEGCGEYIPGEHCQFCRAAVKCRVRAEEKLKLAAFEFALPPLLSNEEICQIYGRLDDLVAWGNSIKEYVLQSAIKGVEWPGYKLVAGRSVRRYTDEAAVAKAAKEAGYHDIYRQSLLPLTEMEKYLSKSKFSKILGGLVVKPQGKPTLVPISDKRPALSMNSAADDFADDAVQENQIKTEE